MVVATPALLKVTVLLPKVAPLVVSAAVWPDSVVAADVQGLDVLVQAVTVTVVGTQLRLVVARDSS